MAGLEKGQEPALFFSVSSSPPRGRPIQPLGSGKGDECAQTKHKARACREPPGTFSPVQSVSQRPSLPWPPRAPAQLSALHGGCQAAPQPRHFPRVHTPLTLWGTGWPVWDESRGKASKGRKGLGGTRESVPIPGKSLPRPWPGSLPCLTRSAEAKITDAGKGPAVRLPGVEPYSTAYPLCDLGVGYSASLGLIYNVEVVAVRQKSEWIMYSEEYPAQQKCCVYYHLPTCSAISIP